jgi:hypothetical protein
MDGEGKNRQAVCFRLKLTAKRKLRSLKILRKDFLW